MNSENQKVVEIRKGENDTTDNNLGELMGKAWATFLVLGAFSLFIMIIAPLLDKDEA